MPASPRLYHDCETLVDDILARLGDNIVVGLPLGLGKANHLINALYRRAEQDPGLSLTIFTALTLETPKAGNELQRRFLGPISERLFEPYPPLEYARGMRKGTLPDNVRVKDFFLQPGAWLGSPVAQQNYTAINYTHALDTLLRAGVNLLLQLVVPSSRDLSQAAERYSVSCNPDITADLLDLRQRGKCQFMSVGQVNSALPFLGGGADRPASDFDCVLQEDAYEFPLYSPPLKPISYTDYAIGLQVASLIPDGGTLQIGIGSIGDAITQGLLLRQQHNAVFKGVIERLREARSASDITETGHFQQGLYGLTEMLVEGFLALIQGGIVKRQVGGAVVHSAFYVGSPVFYRLLEQLPPETRQQIAMMPVSFTNELYGLGPSLSGPSAYGDIASETGKREARVGARFINSAMMVTLTGAVVSDGLENGQVVSGVGGQYNFIAQSFALAGARSIVTLPATRTKAGRARSNICWQYGHVTIPRHLRDIVVTEYGVADLRDQSDADVIAALIEIADSRFQPELMQQAKKAGKLPRDYQIPKTCRNNYPERIQAALAPDTEHLPPFPLGSGMTPEEEHLAPALAKLAPQAGNWRALLALVWKGMKRKPDEQINQSLARMQLDKPRGLRERVYRVLLLATLD